jgi:hypothetical protein
MNIARDGAIARTTIAQPHRASEKRKLWIGLKAHPLRIKQICLNRGCQLDRNRLRRSGFISQRQREIVINAIVPVGFIGSVRITGDEVRSLGLTCTKASTSEGTK